jgi:host factor-I protein
MTLGANPSHVGEESQGLGACSDWAGVIRFNYPKNFLLGGIRPMEKNGQQQNTIQDGFLNSARKERSNVTIYLMSGVKLTGRIKSFDKYSVILEAGSQEQLIFKHAISTVSLPRGGGREFHHPRTSVSAESEHAPEPLAGGSAGLSGGQERR